MTSKNIQASTGIQDDWDLTVMEIDNFFADLLPDDELLTLHDDDWGNRPFTPVTGEHSHTNASPTGPFEEMEITQEKEEAHTNRPTARATAAVNPHGQPQQKAAGSLSVHMPLDTRFAAALRNLESCMRRSQATRQYIISKPPTTEKEDAFTKAVQDSTQQLERALPGCQRATSTRGSKDAAPDHKVTPTKVSVRHSQKA